VRDAHALGLSGAAGRRGSHAVPHLDPRHPRALRAYSRRARAPRSFIPRARRWRGVGAAVTPALALFAAFILIGVPIAFALGAAALVGLWLYEGAPLRIVASRVFGGIDNFSLLAIPFFILAGELMETGGISQRLVTLARVLVGHIRGGLGNVVMIALL